MAYRSNVPVMAGFVFRRLDPEFSKRAREWKGGFIVAGHNYGQGSSREHAAPAPKALGVAAVIAKSFARIHRRNLVAQGIVPLTFVTESAWDRFRQGDEWEIPDLRTFLEGAEQELAVRRGGEVVQLHGHFSGRERQVLLAGGLLAHVSEGGHPFSVNFGDCGSVDQGSPVTNHIPQDEAV